MLVTQNIIIGIIGIIGTLFGAEIVVRNAKEIARSLKINEFFIGLTVLSIGTSLPEIFTHIMSSIRIAFFDQNIEVLSGIAVGTNIGSNIIQITLITGVSGIIGTIYTTKKFLKRDYFIMLLGIVLLFLFSLNHNISHLEGVILAISYILYVFYLYRVEDVEEKIENGNHNKAKQQRNIWRLIKLFFGLGILIYAANLVLDSAMFATSYFHISGSLIGALIIGVATALPEFTTSVISLLRKSSGLSLGTLVGSNITNPLLALGIGAAISEYHIDDAILFFDLPYWFVVSFIIMFIFYKGLKLNRTEAYFLVLFYVLYVVLRLYLFA